MSKYSFVLYYKRQNEFLSKLQELGLVDITSTDWEADAEERAMIATLEQLQGARLYFAEMEKNKEFGELDDRMDKPGYKAELHRRDMDVHRAVGETDAQTSDGQTEARRPDDTVDLPQRDMDVHRAVGETDAQTSDGQTEARRPDDTVDLRQRDMDVHRAVGEADAQTSDGQAEARRPDDTVDLRQRDMDVHRAVGETDAQTSDGQAEARRPDDTADLHRRDARLSRKYPPFAGGEEVFAEYIKARDQIESLTAGIEKARKEADELRVWGDFSPHDIHALADRGIRLRFFSAYTADFGEIQRKYGQDLMLEKISDEGGYTYFVLVQTADGHPVRMAGNDPSQTGNSPARSANSDTHLSAERHSSQLTINDPSQTVDGHPALSGNFEIPFDAQEHRLPEMTAVAKEEQIARMRSELRQWEEVMMRVYASRDMMAAYGDEIKDSLDFSRARNSGRKEADDTLIVMEGWATEESSAKVDALVKSYPDLVYIKERPTPRDDTPVVLKNNKFAAPFELIGQFYSLPRYGTIDLTAFFGPFYMIFFGLCLGDAGYGLVLFLAGFFIRRMKGESMKPIANLTFLCGGAAIVFGFLVGSFFGIQLGGLRIFASMKDKFLTPDNLFTLSLMLGVVQIFFALILKVVNISRQFGFKYSLGTVGWLMVLPSIVIAIFGMLTPNAGIGVDFSEPIVYIPVILGLILMLFFHNPDKNPLRNLGGGLWNTYNDVTGFLGDFLSYIRLFALCLSGGTLAVVFNDLAIGLAPDIPVLKQLVAILILAFGHTINLAMSALGAFVHPMRLSFVEFYKNAGFDAATREFAPLKKTARRTSHHQHNKS